MKFLWLENLNNIVSFQLLVIAKGVYIEGLQKRSWCKGREFYTIPLCILVSFLETFIEIFMSLL